MAKSFGRGRHLAQHEPGKTSLTWIRSRSSKWPPTECDGRYHRKNGRYQFWHPTGACPVPGRSDRPNCACVCGSLARRLDLPLLFLPMFPPALPSCRTLRSRGGVRPGDCPISGHSRRAVGLSWGDGSRACAAILVVAPDDCEGRPCLSLFTCDRKVPEGYRVSRRGIVNPYFAGSEYG